MIEKRSVMAHNNSGTHEEWRHAEADSQQHQEGEPRQDLQDDEQERGERDGRLRVINYIYYE